MVIVVIMMMTSEVIMVTMLSSNGHHKHHHIGCDAVLYAGKCRFGWYIDAVIMIMC